MRFIKAFDIKPKSKKDYYHVFGWLISKKFAFMMAIVVLIASIYYLTVINSPASFQNAGIKTYKYNSIPLRFAKGTVQINDSNGNLTYKGNVDRGEVAGTGILYDGADHVVYEGSFAHNMYDGEGKLYYENGAVKYNGEFKENLYSGIGTLYRSNGRKEYEGEFALGKKNGEGALFDASGNKIFTGDFVLDHVVLDNIVGKKTNEIADIYTGKLITYYDNDYYAVYMKDINAVGYGRADSDNLSEAIDIEGVYVLNNVFVAGSEEYDTIEQLNTYFGEIEYEGNTEIIMPEAVGINCINKAGSKKVADADIELKKDFDDVFSVEGFNEKYSVYMRSYKKDGITYIFYSFDTSEGFSMYEITV